MLWMLLGCDGLSTGINAGDTRIWTANWSDHLVYQSVDAASLGGGGSDTAALGTSQMDAVLAASGSEWAFSARALSESGVGETLRELTFSTADGLSVTQVEGVALDPAVVLLPANWEEGAAVTSGAYTTTTDPLADAVTWYGTFAKVVTVRVEGPAGDPLAGILRFAPDVGLVQFALGTVAGDLAWYDPSAEAGASE